MQMTSLKHCAMRLAMLPPSSMHTFFFVPSLLFWLCVNLSSGDINNLYGIIKVFFWYSAFCLQIRHLIILSVIVNILCL